MPRRPLPAAERPVEPAIHVAQGIPPPHGDPDRWLAESMGVAARRSGGSQQPRLADVDPEQLARAVASRSLEEHTVCGRIHEQTRHAVEAAREIGAVPSIAAVPRDLFVEGCERLPPAIQRCLLPEHRRAHAAECRRVFDEATESMVAARRIRPSVDDSAPP